MGIRKVELKDGTVRYRVEVRTDDRDADGRRRNRSVTVANYREALALEADMKVEAKRGGHVAASKLTVAQLIESYLETGTWSPTTLYGYQRLANREIIPALGRVKLGELRSDRIDRMYKKLRERGLSNRSVHNVHSFLHSALEQACKWGWLIVNPADRATPGPAKAGAGVIATQNEIERILAAADPQLHLAVRLCAATGVRRSELCGLQWSDVDFDKGSIKVERAIVDAAGHTSEKSTKTNQSRIVPLDRGTLTLLREHRGVGPIIAWSPRALSHHLAEICDELGIERTMGRRKRLGWHAFRHYVGTAIANTGDIKAAARRLGHSRTSTTLDMYVHGDEDRDRAAADVMGSLLG